MRKTTKKIMSYILAGALTIGSCLVPNTSYALEPTDYDLAEVLELDEINELRKDDYKYKEDTVLGCFTAEEAAMYSIKIISKGDKYSDTFKLRGEDTAEINHVYLSSGKSKTFYMHLEENEKIYVNIIGGHGDLNRDVLAGNVVISKVDFSCDSSLNLKVRSKKKLSIKNFDGKVKWKSSNTRIASVSYNGTVNARKKGKATITATVTSDDGETIEFNTKVTVK